VETGERLAAYLAGELDADESRALEAQLARDPSLRARLASIRATDELLSGLTPIEVPAAFSARLRGTLSDELDDRLAAPDADTDQLAARRAGRRADGRGRGWWPQLAAAAAVVAIAGIGVSTLVSGSDQARESADTAEEMTTMVAPEPAAGPTVVAAGRSFDPESLRELAEDERFDALMAQRFSDDEAAAAAEAHEGAMGGGTADDGDAATAETGPAPQSRPEGGTDGSDEDAPPQDSALAPPAEDADRGEFGLRTVGEVSEADLAAVRRCLPSLLEAGTTVIPVYAELVTFSGDEAIVYGLVGKDPEQDGYRRVELWVVGRTDCQVLHFTQVDR
jgi:negative regulator of sigma E activity